MSLNRFFCPVFNQKGCLEDEPSFLEIGEYNEQAHSYEKEFCVQGYRCPACQEVFYMAQ